MMIAWIVGLYRRLTSCRCGPEERVVHRGGRWACDRCGRRAYVEPPSWNGRVKDTRP